MYFRLFFFTSMLIVSVIHGPAALAGPCAPKGIDPAKTIERLYAAVSRGDSAALSRLFAPGFYAFDHGQRMSGADLVSQVDEIAKRRPAYTWTVEDADGHATCNTAWVTYTNRHIPLPGADVRPTAYLESAVLVWLDGGWKLRFFHSTPAQSP